MAETRTLQIVASMEPSIYALAAVTAKEEEVSLSTYVRNLIIWDQVKRKKLNTDQMAMIMTGQSLQRIENFLSQSPPAPLAVEPILVNGSPTELINAT